ncbi:MAG: hypothetical protein OEY49_14915 [Candidatus Heimdallarchaeota archaeon]|nr:hypothetical protein [Candidatus Heimdallarchaeota archaeon]
MKFILKAKIFIFVLLLLIVPMVGKSAHEPLDNEFNLILRTNTSVAQLGDSLYFTYGLVDNDSIYLAGYDYRLILINSNFTTIDFNPEDFEYVTLIDGLTEANLMDFDLFLWPNEYPILTHSNVFNLLLEVNITEITPSVHRSILSIEIFVSSDIDFTIDFFDVNQDDRRITDSYNTNINLESKINVQISNLGIANAFDVIMEINRIQGNLNYQSSVGLDSSIINEDLVLPFDTFSFNFTINPDDFGLGLIEFDLTFRDGDNNEFREGRSFVINIIPRIQSTIDINEIPSSDSYEFEVTIQNIDEIAFTGSFRLFSNKIYFVPTETSLLKFESGTNRIYFIGTPQTPGEDTIILYLSVFDSELGDKTEEIFIISKFVTISNDLTIDKEITIWQILLWLLLIILIIGLISLIVKPDLRYKILTAILSFPDSLDMVYSRKSIIVDGSNIAWEELDKNNRPKINNIIKAIDSLKKHGFVHITVIADAALRYQISNKKELDIQTKKGIIKVLPAKVNGDRFILRLSQQTNSLILTNDLFKEFREEFPWIDERRVPYSILNKKLYLHPLFDETE